MTKNAIDAIATAPAVRVNVRYIAVFLYSAGRLSPSRPTWVGTGLESGARLMHDLRLDEARIWVRSEGSELANGP